LDAALADEESGAGDQPGKVNDIRRIGPEGPAELVAERTSRRFRELATLGQREVGRESHHPSVPEPPPRPCREPSRH